MLEVVLVVASVAATSLVFFLWHRSSASIDDLVKREVSVHTDNGVATQGLLEAVSRDCLVLSHAHHLEDGMATPLSGEVRVPRARIWRVDAPRPEDLPGARA